MSFFSATSNVVNTATNTPMNGNGGMTMSDESKQNRLELITYVKAHFDLIAVTLLIAYLGYSIYKLNKGK
jgi:hypothetical protein